MTLEIAKENLFKMKGLSYLEALQSKIELIKNQKEVEIDVELIKIREIQGKYYLQYKTNDERRIALAESTL